MINRPVRRRRGREPGGSRGGLANKGGKEGPGERPLELRILTSQPWKEDEWRCSFADDDDVQITDQQWLVN